MAGTSPKGASGSPTVMERARSVWKRTTHDRAVKWATRYIVYGLAIEGTAETLREALDWSPLVPRFTLYVLLVGLIVLLPPFWIHGHLRRKQAAWWEVVLVAGLLSIGGRTLWKAWGYYSQRLGPSLPDVALRFVDPANPAPFIENLSGVVASKMMLMPTLWDIDAGNNSGGPIPPLQIPTIPFNWLRPHETGGPIALFSRPSVSSMLKRGDRVYGSVSITCPNCARGRTYILALRWGESGWYYQAPHITNAHNVVPLTWTKEGLRRFAQGIDDSVPLSARIPIKPETLKPYSLKTQAVVSKVQHRSP